MNGLIKWTILEVCCKYTWDDSYTNIHSERNIHHKYYTVNV